MKISKLLNMLSRLNKGFLVLVLVLTIISKFKCFKDVGFNTFSKMYQANVVPIVDYSSSVWGYANYDFCVEVRYRAMRYFLGVYPKAPLLGLEGDMGSENCKVRHFLAIIRLWNKLIKMNPDTLTKRIFIWDYNLCKNWCKEVKQFFLINWVS